MIVVIPSARMINNRYIAPLIEEGVRIVVVDDSNDQSITADSENILVLGYDDRRRMLGRFEGCIPRKNGASRDLGFYFASIHADDGEVIVALDDDCEVESDYFLKAAESIGEQEIRSVKTGNRFYNPLDLYAFGSETRIFPRGFPYEERDRATDYEYDGNVTGKVVFNLGLWRGVFDINAKDKLSIPQYSFSDTELRYPQVAVQEGALVSACSMNMIFSKELIPAIYQLPMNEETGDGEIVDRYGDIWGGYICKKLIDIKGDIFSVGEPLIMHHKTDTTSVIQKNIEQEKYSHTVNLAFCDLLDSACEDITPSDYLTMYENLTENLSGLADHYPPSLSDYLKRTVGKMGSWTQALRSGSR